MIRTTIRKSWTRADYKRFKSEIKEHKELINDKTSKLFKITLLRRDWVYFAGQSRHLMLSEQEALLNQLKESGFIKTLNGNKGVKPMDLMKLGISNGLDEKFVRSATNYAIRNGLKPMIKAGRRELGEVKQRKENRKRNFHHIFTKPWTTEGFQQ